MIALLTPTNVAVLHEGVPTALAFSAEKASLGNFLDVTGNIRQTQFAVTAARIEAGLRPLTLALEIASVS